MNRTLSIDIETYSGYNLKDTGVYKYVESPEFAILLFAYAFDDEPVRVVDLASGEELPGEVLDAIMYEDVTLCAHNAAFERICINKHFGWTLPPEQWSCTMVHAAMCGLPLKLEEVAKVLKLSAQKDAAGKRLIEYFCKPCKPTKANGFRTRNLPEHDLEKWERFKAYNVQDVVVEKQIAVKCAHFVISQFEKDLWYLDQRVNDRGVCIDILFVKNALRIDAEYRAKLVNEAVKLTGLGNPNSLQQLKKWLEEETEEIVNTLRKDDVTHLLGITEGVANRVLELRQQMSKTSTKKYKAMLTGICADGRFRGLFQYYGANRTGRWAGRLVQVQNLPKSDDFEDWDLDLARSLVAEGDGETLESYYGNVPDILSKLLRTAFVSPPNKGLGVADAAAIEARILAWLANEKWRLKVFEGDGRIYEASAAQMFKVPIESIDKKNPLRQKGKIAELALGYQGSVGALITMGALKKGLQESELKPLVDAWRAANPNIVSYWYAVQSAAITAVETGMRQTVKPGIHFYCINGFLFIELPSGRKLSYLNPTLKLNKFDKLSLSYEGMDQDTKKWGRVDTYGGKIVENITQGFARDCLATSMLKVDGSGYDIVLHVHDEIVTEIADGVGSLSEIEQIMSEPIPWAPGLPLGADGFESNYYKK